MKLLRRLPGNLSIVVVMHAQRPDPDFYRLSENLRFILAGLVKATDRAGMENDQKPFEMTEADFLSLLVKHELALRAYARECLFRIGIWSMRRCRKPCSFRYFCLPAPTNARHKNRRS